MHYIKTGKLDKKYGRLLSQLFDWRQKGDYENIFDYDHEISISKPERSGDPAVGFCLTPKAI